MPMTVMLQSIMTTKTNNWEDPLISSFYSGPLIHYGREPRQPGYCIPILYDKLRKLLYNPYNVSHYYYRSW